MKKFILSLFCFVFYSISSVQVFAQNNHRSHNNSSGEGDYKLHFVKQEKNQIYMQLKKNDRLVPFKNLKTVHENKLHVFVISSDLEFYTHTHPQEETLGVFSFNLPLVFRNKNYRVWAEFTENQTSKEYKAFFDSNNGRMQKPNFKESLTVVQDGYEYTLSSNKPFVYGRTLLLTIDVKKNGRKFINLEPIMGESGHLVGFLNNNQNVIHMHPISTRNKELTFSTTFKEKGFAKLFLQVKINGEEKIIPFTVKVD